MDHLIESLQDLKQAVAKNMADEINREVLRAILMEQIYPYGCRMYATEAISDWVEQTVGPQTVNWDYADGTYYFKQQQDLEFFVLKWIDK